jgi:hypothetical protein
MGKPNDKETWRKAKLLVDHCLEVAWDEKNGGFFYEGHIGGGPSDRKKIWWTTAEGLNALRIFAQKFGGIYQTRYAQLWNFVLSIRLIRCRADGTRLWMKTTFRLRRSRAMPGRRGTTKDGRFSWRPGRRCILTTNECVFSVNLLENRSF